MNEPKGTKVVSSQGEHDFKTDAAKMMHGVRVFSKKGEEGALQIDRSAITTAEQLKIFRP